MTDETKSFGFNAALIAMKRGGTVRRAHWSEGYSMKLSEAKNDFVFQSPELEQYQDELSTEDLLAEDWEHVMGEQVTDNEAVGPV